MQNSSTRSAFSLRNEGEPRNPAFPEAREWHIINLPVEFDGDIGGGQTMVLTIGTRHLRIASGRLISYYRMPFQPEAIREIILGPRRLIGNRELGLLRPQHHLGHVEARDPQRPTGGDDVGAIRTAHLGAEPMALDQTLNS